MKETKKMILCLALIYSLVIAIPLVVKAQAEQSVKTQSQEIQSQTENEFLSASRPSRWECTAAVITIITGGMFGQIVGGIGFYRYRCYQIG